MRRAFIIGGTGQIGRAIANRLLERGWTVLASHRGQREVPRDLLERGLNLVRFDREQQGGLEAARGADVVIDTVAFDDRHGRQLLSLGDSIGSLIVISSASVYRDAAGRTLDEARECGFPELPEPIAETQATVAPGPETYSTRKVALERTLIDAGRVPVSILRPCAIYGIGSDRPREWWFVKRMLDHRRMIPLAYGGRSRLHTTSVEDIAQVAEACSEKPASRILNVADREALPVTDIGKAIAGHVGYAGRLVPVENEGFPAQIGATPWSVFRPFVLSTGAAEQMGYKPADYSSAVGLGGIQDRDWRSVFPGLASGPRDLFDYDTEDRFLATVCGDD